MDIKSATKAVNQELKKVKEVVSEWHTKREEIFNDLKDSWRSQYAKSVKDLQDHTINKDILVGLKEFDKFNQKSIQDNIKKLIELNTEYSLKTKVLSKNLGELASPYLKTIKSPEFGVGVKAVSAIEKEIIGWIDNEAFEEFDVYKAVRKIDKKMSVATQSLTKQATTEIDHLKSMAKVEIFVDTMLNSLNEPFTLSKASMKSIENNSVLSQMLYEVQTNTALEQVGKAIDSLSVLNDSVQVDALANSYGSAADEASFKRSKSAMQGVRGSFSYFKKCFEESFAEDRGTNSIKSMYLNDMKDHLNLAKSCLINDPVAMNDNYAMDTGSRELMSDSLHSYLNSDKFFEELSAQKKLNKKPKP